MTHSVRHSYIAPFLLPVTIIIIVIAVLARRMMAPRGASIDNGRFGSSTRCFALAQKYLINKKRFAFSNKSLCRWIAFILCVRAQKTRWWSVSDGKATREKRDARTISRRERRTMSINTQVVNHRRFSFFFLSLSPEESALRRYGQSTKSDACAFYWP